MLAQRVILAEGMAFEAFIKKKPPQVGMSPETDSEQVIDRRSSHPALGQSAVKESTTGWDPSSGILTRRRAGETNDAKW